MIVRDEDLYDMLLEGDKFETETFIWADFGGKTYMDDKEDELNFSSMSSAQKKLVSSESSWNLKVGSTDNMKIDCDVDSNASRDKCGGATCRANSECHSNKCATDGVCKKSSDLSLTDAEAAIGAAILIVIFLIICCCCAIGCCVFCMCTGSACFSKSGGSRRAASAPPAQTSVIIVQAPAPVHNNDGSKSDRSDKSDKSKKSSD